MTETDFSNKAKQLIDDIKGICTSAGLGGDANEYKIVTQSFLYKFLSDKFMFEASQINSSLKSYQDFQNLPESDYDLLLIRLGTKAAHFRPEHLLDYLFAHSNDQGFAKLFDNTLNDIAIINTDVFSVHTSGNTEIRLFEEELIGRAVNDRSQHDVTARKIINALANSKFNFDEIFSAGFDFFSTLFEYMIKDFNKDGSGKYAEYYTPHSVSKIMADILVGTDLPSNVTVYDPAAGSGTLLMNLAHRIGSDRCTVYSQDMSQKSSNLLRLNLILNNLSHSIDHIVQGNTVVDPRHITQKFDFIASNPPFDPQMQKTDYDDILRTSSLQSGRFKHGIPNLVSDKKSETGKKMYIYLLFIQHIIFSLSDSGKVAIVVPTGFLTASGKIEKNIKEELVAKGWLKGAINMPSNIFATTGTNVSILFIDKNSKNSDILLMDASKLGESYQDNGNKRTRLTEKEQKQIIDIFSAKQQVDDLSVVVSTDEIKAKNYSLSAGQYFEIKIDYVDITPAEFADKMKGYQDKLDEMFAEGNRLNENIKSGLKNLKNE